MTSVYLLLLILTFSSLLLYLQTSEDIPFVLAGLTGIVCFIWGFAFAHWSLQILIVLGLLRLYKLQIPDSLTSR